jgi:hypothetical protein
MEDLIAKLEAADGPSDDLDVALSKQFGVGLYTHFLDDALLLVPERYEHDWSVTAAGSGTNGATIGPTFGGWHADFKGATPALALCIAALKARQAIAAENAA